MSARTSRLRPTTMALVTRPGPGTRGRGGRGGGEGGGVAVDPVEVGVVGGGPAGPDVAGGVPYAARPYAVVGALAWSGPAPSVPVVTPPAAGAVGPGPLGCASEAGAVAPCGCPAAGGGDVDG